MTEIISNPPHELAVRTEKNFMRLARIAQVIYFDGEHRNNSEENKFLEYNEFDARIKGAVSSYVNKIIRADGEAYILDFNTPSTTRVQIIDAHNYLRKLNFAQDDVFGRDIEEKRTGNFSISLKRQKESPDFMSRNLDLDVKDDFGLKTIFSNNWDEGGFALLTHYNREWNVVFDGSWIEEKSDSFRVNSKVFKR